MFAQYNPELVPAVATAIALHPNETRWDIEPFLDIHPTEILRAIYDLRGREQVRYESIRTVVGRGIGDLLVLTDRFWEAEAGVVTAVSKLSDDDRALYEEAVSEHQCADKLPQGSVEQRRARANFRGRCIELSENSTLGKVPGWYPGVGGLIAHVTIEAHGARPAISRQKSALTQLSAAS